MQKRQGRFLVAAALATVLALSGASAFADGGGSEPFPKPAGASVFAEVASVFGYYADAASYVVDSVY